MNRQQQQPHADKSKATQGSAPSASEPRDMLESRRRSDWKLESEADCPLTASGQAAPEGPDSLLQHACGASSLRLQTALASKSPRLSGECQARGVRRRADCSKRSWCPSRTPLAHLVNDPRGNSHDPCAQTIQRCLPQGSPAGLSPSCLQQPPLNTASLRQLSLLPHLASPLPHF